MCGIMGMILKQEDREAEELNMLRARFTNLLVATEIRGRDAAGAFVVNKPRQGVSPIRFTKAQGSASSLVRNPKFHALMNTIGTDTIGAIGHTRMATQGCPTCNANNHPIIMKNQIVGVHNGMLVNDEEIREEFPFDQEVDSAAIFAALSGNSGEKALTAKVIAETLPIIEGDMAIAVADTRNSNRLFVARDNGRPLFLLEDEDAIWLASTPEILSTGLKTMARFRAQSLDAFSVMTFNGGREDIKIQKW